MICLADALALPDDLGHQMVHPVIKINDLGHWMHLLSRFTFLVNAQAIR